MFLKVIKITCLVFTLFSALSPSVSASAAIKEDQFSEFRKLAAKVRSSDKNLRDSGIKEMKIKIDRIPAHRLQTLIKKFNLFRDRNALVREFSRLTEVEKVALIMTIIPTNYEFNNTRSDKSYPLASKISCDYGNAEIVSKNYFGQALYKYGLRMRSCWNGKVASNPKIAYKYHATYSWGWKFNNHAFEYCSASRDRWIANCVAGGEFEGGIPTPWGQVVIQREYPVVEGVRNARGYFYGGGWFL